MQFILTAGWEDGVAELAKRLVLELNSGQQVLWLLSGGSNVPASVQIMHNISRPLSKRLSIMLVDERYGYVGHDESNWTKLIKAGFDPGNAQIYPVLQTGDSFQQTTKRYAEIAEQALGANDLVIAQLGMGEDGHIAGILPDSVASNERQSLAVSYETGTLKRLTLTPYALQKCDAVYCFAFGIRKRHALQQLQAERLPLNKQPAQLLWQLPEVYIYNDQVGGES